MDYNDEQMQKRVALYEGIRDRDNDGAGNLGAWSAAALTVMEHVLVTGVLDDEWQELANQIFESVPTETLYYRAMAGMVAAEGLENPAFDL